MLNLKIVEEYKTIFYGIFIPGMIVMLFKSLVFACFVSFIASYLFAINGKKEKAIECLQYLLFTLLIAVLGLVLIAGGTAINPI